MENKNKALIGVGIVATIATIGTTVYYLTRKTKEQAPEIPEEIPYVPPAEEGIGIVQPGEMEQSQITGVSGTAIVPSQFKW